jgi:hypothetical protein
MWGYFVIAARPHLHDENRLASALKPINDILP